MYVDSAKIEIINWITRLKDPLLIGKLLELKNKGADGKTGKKIYGSGKHLIEFIAEDFNEPLDEFKPFD
jgi:hypothetical protein